MKINLSKETLAELSEFRRLYIKFRGRLLAGRKMGHAEVHRFNDLSSSIAAFVCNAVQSKGGFEGSKESE